MDFLFLWNKILLLFHSNALYGVLFELILTGLGSYFFSLLANCFLHLKQNFRFISEFKKEFGDFKEEVEQKLENLEEKIELNQRETGMTYKFLQDIQTSFSSIQERIRNLVTHD